MSLHLMFRVTEHTQATYLPKVEYLPQVGFLEGPREQGVKHITERGSYQKATDI